MFVVLSFLSKKSIIIIIIITITIIIIIILYSEWPWFSEQNFLYKTNDLISLLKLALLGLLLKLLDHILHLGTDLWTDLTLKSAK